MDFDKVFTSGGVDYGLLSGTGGVVFIKAGAGGDFCGYEEKYLKMAHRIRSSQGYTVLCGSNPHDGSVESDALLLRKLIAEGDEGDPLYFIGSSRGATLGLLKLSYLFSFRRMLLINMPLMVDYHKLLRALPNSEVRAVFGSRDPSAPYIPFISRHGVGVVTIRGADHLFTDMTDDFVALSDLLFDGQCEGEA